MQACSPSQPWRELLYTRTIFRKGVALLSRRYEAYVGRARPAFSETQCPCERFRSDSSGGEQWSRQSE